MGHDLLKLLINNMILDVVDDDKINNSQYTTLRNIEISTMYVIITTNKC